MFKKILHPTDFSDVSLLAFDQAVALALRYGAQLQLVHAVVLHQYDPESVDEGIRKLNESYNSLRKELKVQLAQMVDGSDIANDLCSISIKRGTSAGDVIIEKAEKSRADLIVMGTHGHSPVRHFFLGSEAEKVVRYAPCPVMVLGRMEDAPGKFKKILLPVDFSPASEAAAKAASSLAQVHGAEIHLVHVYQDILPPRFYGVVESVFKWDSDLKKRGEAALAKFAKRHLSERIAVEHHFLEGRVASSIVQMAEAHEMDLIVIGTNGERGMHRFFIGSVAEKVLRRAAMPVLTVRPEGRDR